MFLSHCRWRYVGAIYGILNNIVRKSTNYTLLELHFSSNLCTPLPCRIVCIIIGTIRILHGIEQNIV